jgi:HlyD family secretion protein
MKRILLLGLALVLLGCDEKPKDGAYLGYVEGERVAVAAPESGWIEEVFVAEGDQVAVGQKLFRLEARRETAQRDQAKARLDETESRLSNLLTGKRTDELKAIEAQIAQVEANLSLTRRDLARQQELASSPAANPRLLDQARSANAAEQAKMKIGARLAIACDGCARDLSAQVSFVAGEAEFTPPVLYAIESRRKLTYLVKARPSGGQLKPGQPIEARLLP